MTLTREQVLEMDAGREMDVLVMEKIFNAEKRYYGDEEVWYHHDSNGLPDYEWSFHNSPSTDISAAWEVLEQFPLMICERVEIFAGHVTVNATIYPTSDSEKAHTATASNAPLAICRAALLAALEEESA
jgi:hypothetical protein